MSNPPTFTLTDALRLAAEHHQANRLYEAEQLYRAILQAVPDQAQANHGLGVLAGQLGRAAEGLPFLITACRAEPGNTQYWLAYIDGLIATGQLGEAQAALDTARRRGVGDAALSSATTPNSTEVAELTGLFDAARYAELEARAESLRRRVPLSAFPWMMFGLARHMQGKEGLPALQCAAELAPERADVHNTLGNVQREAGKVAEATASFRRALEIRPDYAEAHNNLGNALQDVGRLEDAEASYRRALQLKSDFYAAHNNLGNVLRQLGRLDEAAECYRRAAALQPDNAETHFNIGLCSLNAGNFAQGWPKYEYRWEGATPRLVRPATKLPQWRGGTPRPGERLLVFEEQGMGDRLQFVRYLSLVAQRFPDGVTVVGSAALSTLFRRSFPQIEFLGELPVEQCAWHWQCPLLSLPLAFATTLASIPREVPYLVPSPKLIATWQAKINALCLLPGARKIGVVWKTGKAMKDAPLRSLHLEQLSAALNLPGSAWFSLQKEADPQSRAWVENGKLIDWSEEFHDYDDTAALLANLDLVLAVDTGVAHLAGALGIPTWLVVRSAGEWRWLRNCEDSPWYPTLRIFRQTTEGDWDGVIARVAAELAALPPRQIA